MFEKIMEFMLDNSMNVTNPRNTYESINVVSCKEIEDFLRELFCEDETEDRFF